METLKIEEEIGWLTIKYQENPDSLLKDYDETIKKSLIAIIANYNAIGVLRDDIISIIDVLIRNRQFIVDNYSNKGGSNNQK